MCFVPLTLTLKVKVKKFLFFAPDFKNNLIFYLDLDPKVKVKKMFSVLCCQVQKHNLTLDPKDQGQTNLCFFLLPSSKTKFDLEVTLTSKVKVKKSFLVFAPAFLLWLVLRYCSSLGRKNQHRD